MTKLEILKLETQLLEALRNTNIQLLDALSHEESLFIDPRGKIINKINYLEALRIGKTSVDHISGTNYIVDIGHSNATVSVLININGMYLGQPIHGKFLYLRVWGKSTQHWKIIAESAIHFES